MKYRFGSGEWLAAVHGIFLQRALCLAARRITDRVSICEVYRDVPAEIGVEGGQVSWSCVYQNGAVDFQLRERDDVAFKVVGEYGAFAPLSMYAVNDDPQRAAEYARLAMAEVKAGRIEIQIGQGFTEPGDLKSLHDVIVGVTCL